MGDLTTFETIIIAIVEGLTEFLPVSSTGHMIIAQNVLGVESTEFVKAFTVIIQFGAILSVVCLYWKRFFRLNHAPVPENTPAIKRFLHKFDFYWKLLVAFIPAAVLGFLFSDKIDEMLESVAIVAVMLVIGGIFMLFCDKIFSKGSEDTVLTEKKAFNIGLFHTQPPDDVVHGLFSTSGLFAFRFFLLWVVFADNVGDASPVSGVLSSTHVVRLAHSGASGHLIFSYPCNMASASA